MPVVKNNTKAKITDIIMATLIFLYCFAFIFFLIADFKHLNGLLTLNISSNIKIYSRD